MSTSLHAGRIGARPALESVTTIVWVSGTQEARPAAVAARVDRDRDRSAGSNFRTCSVFPLASLTMPFVFPHHCLNFTNPCSQMALPGLGLIPPPYAFDAAGNIVPTPLMCRAALIGNLIGRIVRVSHTTFSAAADDEDPLVLAHYGPGQYQICQLIGTVLGFDFDEDGDMTTMLIRLFVGKRTHPTTAIGPAKITASSACRSRGLRCSC